jgi:hypothetical protein
LVARGYAAIAYYNGDVDPDVHDGFTNGVHGVFQPDPKVRTADSWGTIAAWAWGASRVMDWRNALNNEQSQQLGFYSGLPTRTGSLLTGYANTLQPYTAQNQIDAQNARQSQLLADEAYWRRKEADNQNKNSMWSTIGTLGGYLFG